MREPIIIGKPMFLICDDTPTIDLYQRFSKFTLEDEKGNGLYIACEPKKIEMCEDGLHLEYEGFSFKWEEK